MTISSTAPMTVADLKRVFPELAEVGTGGNCTALEITCRGHTVTLTAADGDPLAPLDTDTEVLISPDDLEDPTANLDVKSVAEVAEFLTRLPE